MSRLVHRRAAADGPAMAGVLRATGSPVAGARAAPAHPRRYRSIRRPALPAAVLTLGVWAVRPNVAAAHGTGVAEPLTPITALTAWAFDPLVWGAVAIAAGGYLWAVRSVGAAHPRSPVPRRRIAAWMLGLAAILVALQSSLDVYAGSLFSVHMVQHLLLTMVAAPLLALGAPITLLLRVASRRVRRDVVLPVLHARVVRVLAFPVVTWIVFSGFMWVAHFSPLFDAALESPLVHQAEHVLFLATAMLFWWPVVGADPAPWRLPHPARVGYLFLGMPWSSFLGLAIYSASTVLYRHYATLTLGWAPSAREDQAVAGGIMWAGGDLLFLAALGVALWVWLNDEDAKGRRHDAKLDRLAARPDVLAGAAGRGSVPAPDGRPRV